MQLFYRALEAASEPGPLKIERTVFNRKNRLRVSKSDTKGKRFFKMNKHNKEKNCDGKVRHNEIEIKSVSMRHRFRDWLTEFYADVSRAGKHHHS